MLNKILLIVMLATFGSLFSQRVGFISSDMIRDKFPETEAAEQKIQSVVEDWKIDLQMMQSEINNIEFELKKNRLIWTDKEINQKQEQLNKLKKERKELAKKRFGPNGDYEQLVTEIMRPVEEKINKEIMRPIEKKTK